MNIVGSEPNTVTIRIKARSKSCIRTQDFPDIIGGIIENFPRIGQRAGQIGIRRQNRVEIVLVRIIDIHTVSACAVDLYLDFRFFGFAGVFRIQSNGNGSRGDALGTGSSHAADQHLIVLIHQACDHAGGQGNLSSSFTGDIDP